MIVARCTDAAELTADRKLDVDSRPGPARRDGVWPLIYPRDRMSGVELLDSTEC